MKSNSPLYTGYGEHFAMQYNRSTRPHLYSARRSITTRVRRRESLPAPRERILLEVEQHEGRTIVLHQSKQSK